MLQKWKLSVFCIKLKYVIYVGMILTVNCVRIQKESYMAEMSVKHMMKNIVVYVVQKLENVSMKRENHMVVLNVNRGKNVIFAEIIILTLMERVRIGKGSIMVGKNVLHMKYMYVIYVEKIIGEVIARIMKGLGMMRDIVNLIN